MASSISSASSSSSTSALTSTVAVVVGEVYGVPVEPSLSTSTRKPLVVILPDAYAGIVPVIRLPERLKIRLVSSAV